MILFSIHIFVYRIPDQWIWHWIWEDLIKSERLTESDRNSDREITIRSDSHMMIISHLINIHLISIMLQCSDLILLDYWILSNLTVGLGQISTSGIPCDFISRTSIEFHRISYDSNKILSGSLSNPIIEFKQLGCGEWKERIGFFERAILLVIPVDVYTKTVIGGSSI